MKPCFRVRANPGSGAAEVAGDGSLTGVVQAVEKAPADGVVHVVVLMDEECFAVHSPVADWEWPRLLSAIEEGHAEP